jgi:hypothetical protein
MFNHSDQELLAEHYRLTCSMHCSTQVYSNYLTDLLQPSIASLHRLILLRNKAQQRVPKIAQAPSPCIPRNRYAPLALENDSDTDDDLYHPTEFYVMGPDILHTEQILVRTEVDLRSQVSSLSSIPVEDLLYYEYIMPAQYWQSL